MDRLYLLVKDYSSTWRHVLPKQKFFEEFGELSEGQITEHNFKVLENHNLMLDMITKMNTMNPHKASEEDIEYVNVMIEFTDNFVEKDFIAIFNLS